MELHLPNGLSITLSGIILSGIIRQREGGLVLEMPDTDLKTNRPVMRLFPVVGSDAQAQAQLRAHLDQSATLRGVWHAESAKGGLTGLSFLEVTAVGLQED